MKATHNHLIIGSVRAFEQEGTCYIGKLIVDAAFPDQGLGRRLMQSIESHFPQATRFELFTGHKSRKNLYLYDRLGYQEIRR